MKIGFPSVEFDQAVGAVCGGVPSDEQMRALNELLRRDAAARDEYLFRIELHARLASDPDLFSSLNSMPAEALDPPALLHLQGIDPIQQNRPSRGRKTNWAFALAVCFVIAAAGLLSFSLFGPAAQKKTSKAVAMLNRVVDAKWSVDAKAPRLGAPLEPGSLRLDSGLAQVVFYSGARVVVEGPAELAILSQNKAACRRGRIKADVPAQARGFQLETPHLSVTEAPSSFGLEVNERETELHVFKGGGKFQPSLKAVEQDLREGAAVTAGLNDNLRFMQANATAFAALFNLPESSLAAEALRYERWQDASEQLNSDPTLLAHFDFGDLTPNAWQVRNSAGPGATTPDAAIVGCQRGEGRWPEKNSLEFRSVNDRVRLNVPGEYESLTMTAWVSVKGLDRQINSLLMSDGFEHGTVHWYVRHDGVLGITVIGAEPRNHQIALSPPVLTLEKLGTWALLAVVVDGSANRITHFVNGAQVSESRLKIDPPFRIGAAELGNWNPKGFPENDPMMIRNFSGSIDEFCVFGRALGPSEIHRLYSAGRPQGDAGGKDTN